jgi:DNA-binding CsgD family transcriptional regulator
VKTFNIKPANRPRSRGIRFDPQLLQALDYLAESLGRPPAELAAELLKRAITRRTLAENNLRRWQSLSPREQQTVALLCYNLSNVEIAATLGISSETARSYVQAALIKFDLHSRADLRLALADFDFGL